MSRHSLYIFLVALFAFIIFLGPFLSSQQVSAAQITKRQVTISSGQPGASSVTYTIGASTGGSDTTNGFFFGTSHIVKGMKLQFCSNAVGTCSGATGIDVKTSSGGFTLTGWQDSTAFTKTTTNTGDCDGTQTYNLCISRAGAVTNEDTTHSHKIVITGITNPSTANYSFFIRMSTYTDANYTLGNLTDTGSVATSTNVLNFTVSAAVSEVLNFCIGNTSVDDAGTTSPGTDCTTISGTSVNLGNIDTTHVNVTPLSTNCTAADCNKNAIAMVRSNAANGTSVYYAAIAQSGSNHTRDLRVAGNTCESTADNTTSSVTDYCFNQSATQGTITAGTEKWGVTIAGVNCKSSASYASCTGTANSNLARDAAYDGNGTTSYVSESNQSVTGTTSNAYAWDESGSYIIMATSSSSTVKEIDDEALILKFAATTSITTPFGAYTAKADFTCVASY